MKHGIRYTTEESDEHIWRLRHDEKLDLKDVAEIVSMSISGVSRRYDELAKFRIYSDQEAKPDNRKKVDRKEVLQLLEAGTSVKETAEKCGITPGRVSQIAALIGDPTGFTWSLNCEKFDFLFTNATLNHQLYPVHVWFYPEGIYTEVMKTRGGHNPDIRHITFWSKHVFDYYKVENPFALSLKKEVLENISAVFTFKSKGPRSSRLLKNDLRHSF